MEVHFMPDSLQDLETRRAHLAKQIAGLGDLHSGSISDTSGRCGKSNCRCHQPGQPVHGPNPRLTYKDQGKSVTEALPTPAAQKKAEREIAEFRHFEQLRRAFIDVNAKICRARSAEHEPTSKKKNDGGSLRNSLQPIRTATAKDFADRRKPGQLDLEAAEMAIRSTVHQTGADAVTELLRLAPPDDDHRRVACTCGRAARYEGMRTRPILTVVGGARIDGPYYLCPVCHTGQFPADGNRDIEQTDFSPGVWRMLAAVGGVAPFAQGRDQIKLLAGLEVTAKTVERTAESIGEDIEIRQQKLLCRAPSITPRLSCNCVS